jgi:DNA-directed RNA polymerase specialized sigma54-like protein
VSDDQGPSDDTKPLLPPEEPVMTPQLQLALRLLSTPASELPALLTDWKIRHPGAIVELLPGDVDPHDVREHELVAEEPGHQPFFYYDEEPFPQLGADVWVFGNPPQVRANGRALPRFKSAYDEAALTRSAADIRHASWLIRGLRQRARTYEQVVAAVVGIRPRLAIAPDPSEIEPVTVGVVAQIVGVHESTIRRVAAACRFQTLHGVMRLAVTGKWLSFARYAAGP